MPSTSNTLREPPCPERPSVEQRVLPFMIIWAVLSLVIILVDPEKIGDVMFMTFQLIFMICAAILGWKRRASSTQDDEPPSPQHGPTPYA